MRDHEDGTTRRPSTQADIPEASGNPLVPQHVFDPGYLQLMAHRDEPWTGSEADVAGPWHLERFPGGHAVLREGESLRRGDVPMARFAAEDAAQLCAAVLPGTGRSRRYQLGPDPDAEGYPIHRDGRLVGHLALFDPDLMAALNVADALVSSPRDFAWLLDAAGGLLLDHAGKIALARALV